MRKNQLAYNSAKINLNEKTQNNWFFISFVRASGKAGSFLLFCGDFCVCKVENWKLKNGKNVFKNFSPKKQSTTNKIFI